MAFYTSIQYSTKKDGKMNHTAQIIREIVLRRFSVYIRFFGEKSYETCRTHAKKYLHSICLQIHTDYVAFSFEEIFAIRMYRTLYCLYKHANDCQ